MWILKNDKIINTNYIQLIFVEPDFMGENCTVYARVGDQSIPLAVNLSSKEAQEYIQNLYINLAEEVK